MNAKGSTFSIIYATLERKRYPEHDRGRKRRWSKYFLHLNKSYGGTYVKGRICQKEEASLENKSTSKYFSRPILFYLLLPALNGCKTGPMHVNIKVATVTVDIGPHVSQRRPMDLHDPRSRTIEPAIRVAVWQLTRPSRSFCQQQLTVATRAERERERERERENSPLFRYNGTMRVTGWKLVPHHGKNERKKETEKRERSHGDVSHTVDGGAVRKKKKE